MGKTKTKPKKNGKAKAKPLPEVMILAEAAAFLRVSDDQLLKAVEARQVPGQRIGREWRFTQGAILDWMSRSSLPGMTSGAELVQHIRRVNAATGFHETDEEIESFLAELRSRRDSEAVVSK